MPSIGLRHLKTHASEVLRDVHDNRTRYVVTSRNRPIAVIVPYSPQEVSEPENGEQAWAEFLAAGEQVRLAWTSPSSAADILRQIRR